MCGRRPRIPRTADDDTGRIAVKVISHFGDEPAARGGGDFVRQPEN
jgi:hypothetical protein